MNIVSYLIKRSTLCLGVAVALTVAAPRSAAAATVCSLTTAGSGCSFGQGLFFADDQHPAGTGYIDSFLRIQQNGDEQGYNTSARPVQFDQKTDLTSTHDLAVADVGTEKIGGIDYYAFFLDVNESASSKKSYLTLNQLEIYGSNGTDLTGYSNNGANNATGALTGASKLYDMDTASSDNAITLNYDLSGSGSGSSDMVFYLPKSLLGGYTYVTLYSQFGNINGSNKKYASNGGFEEWFTMSSIPVTTQFTAIPEPSTMLLLGTGTGFLLRRRKKSSKA
jgi:hypothetical protein